MYCRRVLVSRYIITIRLCSFFFVRLPVLLIPGLFAHPKTISMKKTVTTGLLLCSALAVYAQSSQWIFSPNLRMSATTGVVSLFPASSDIANCSLSYSSERQGVYSNSVTGSYIAFNDCGFYNSSGMRTMPGSGNNNVFGVPGRCNMFYSVRWETPAMHDNNDQFVIREWNTDDPNNIREVATTPLVSNGTYYPSKNEAVGPLSTGGRRYVYAAYNNKLSIFHVSVYGNIYSDGSVTLPATVSNSLKMEATPDGAGVIVCTDDRKIYKFDRASGSFSLIASFPLGTVIAGIEVVPAPSPATNDMLYVSWHRNTPTPVGDISRYDMVTGAGPFSATLTLPSSVSRYQCGFSELERALNGRLYFAASTMAAPATVTATSPNGVLHTLTPATNTVAQVFRGSTIPVYISDYQNAVGYLIQSQIDGDKYDYSCNDGCNSGFTISYTTVNPGNVTFTPNNAAQSQTFKWDFGSAGVVYYNGAVNRSYAFGSYGMSLNLLDPADPWNECFTGANFCLNPAAAQPGVANPGGNPANAPCQIEPDFEVIDMNWSRIRIRPLTAGPYYFIDWGDGNTEYAVTLPPSGYFTHQYYSPGSSFRLGSGVFTICLQTGNNAPLDCKKCIDVCVSPRTYRLVAADPERKAPSFAQNGQVSGASLSLTSIFPNPTQDQLHVDILSKGAEEVNVRLLSVAGQEVLRKKYRLNEGANRLDLSLTGLSNGIYFLQVDGKTQTLRGKVIRN